MIESLKSIWTTSYLVVFWGFLHSFMQLVLNKSLRVLVVFCLGELMQSQSPAARSLLLTFLLLRSSEMSCLFPPKYPFDWYSLPWYCCLLLIVKIHCQETAHPGPQNDKSLMFFLSLHKTMRSWGTVTSVTDNILSSVFCWMRLSAGNHLCFTG